MAKRGTKYKCETCGVVMVVDKACGCTPCDLICCGTPMKEVKAKAKPKAKPKAKKVTFRAASAGIREAYFK